MEMWKLKHFGRLKFCGEIGLGAVVVPLFPQRFAENVLNGCRLSERRGGGRKLVGGDGDCRPIWFPCSMDRS